MKENPYQFPKKPSIKGVNRLVRKAFGIGCKGNWYEFFQPSCGAHYNKKSNKLDLIGKIWTVSPLLIPIPLLDIPLWSRMFGFISYKGRFTSEDGSSIDVLSKYSKQAEKYSELYKKTYGKEVSVHTISD